MSQYYVNKFTDTLPKSKAVFKLESAFDITIYKQGKERFAVQYGMQVDDNLNYSQTCEKLGQAMMHALACDGKLD